MICVFLHASTPYRVAPLLRNCVATEYNCFSKVKKQYTENLKNGFLKNGQYFDPILIGVGVVNMLIVVHRLFIVYII